MNEVDRQIANVSRLRKIDETIRPQVESILNTLEFYGFRPKIAREVWRNPAEQLEMYRRGVSRARWGFHCATRNGQPASLAADIVDADKDWDAPLRFWVVLGYAARAQGLGWGGYWGLNKALRAGLDRALDGVKTGAPIPRGLKIGWDAAHVETARVTIAEAKAGKR